MGSKLLAGRYELIEKIGEGGMAVVYKAKCNLLNRFVTVKILKPEYVKDENFLNNFRKEAQSAAGLSHPNIVSVFDVGKEGNINYIVMEYVEGKTLSEIIKEQAPLPYKRVLDFSKQIVKGLEAAHSEHIIHRDIKPQNIMVTKEGVAKIMDFGIAKAMTETSVIETTQKIVGSVHYFSPEQARGSYVDERSDLYSLGIVMYEMLTGELPYDGENAVTVALMHINDPIVPPSKIVSGIPPALERMIMKLTEKFQNNRHDSAAKVLIDLENIDFVTNVVGNSVFTEDPDLVEKAGARLQAKNEEEIKNGDRKRKIENKNRNKKSNKRLLIIGAIALLVVLASGVGVLYSMGYFSSVTKIEVPSFLDLTFEEAEALALEHGLQIKQGDLIEDEVVEEGKIVSQNPAEGEIVSEDKIITVNISKGKKENIVPSVVGLMIDDVESYLETFEYTIGDITEIEDEAEAGTILSQSPEAGTDGGDIWTLDVVVSLGEPDEEFLMPNVIGFTLQAAINQITGSGFTIGNINYETDTTAPVGTVKTQQYPPGTPLHEGTPVNIVIVKEPVETPTEPEPDPDPEP